MNDFHVEELTEEEQEALVKDVEHHQLPSCQSDEQSDGTSDLATGRDSFDDEEDGE